MRRNVYLSNKDGYLYFYTQHFSGFINVIFVRVFVQPQIMLVKSH